MSGSAVSRELTVLVEDGPASYMHAHCVPDAEELSGIHASSSPPRTNFISEIRFLNSRFELQSKSYCPRGDRDPIAHI